MTQFLAKLGHVPGLPGHVPIIPPVTKAIIDKYTEDIAVDGSLIQKELGFMPQYDIYMPVFSSFVVPAPGMGVYWPLTFC